MMSTEMSTEINHLVVSYSDFRFFFCVGEVYAEEGLVAWQHFPLNSHTACESNLLNESKNLLLTSQILNLLQVTVESKTEPRHACYNSDLPLKWRFMQVYAGLLFMEVYAWLLWQHSCCSSFHRTRTWYHSLYGSVNGFPANPWPLKREKYEPFFHRSCYDALCMT
jgi:hypothetical protein